MLEEEKNAMFNIGGDKDWTNTQTFAKIIAWKCHLIVSFLFNSKIIIKTLYTQKKLIFYFEHHFPLH